MQWGLSRFGCNPGREMVREGFLEEILSHLRLRE
jgi:hypothetical protein